MSDKSIYVGNGGKAHEAKHIYAGVNGVAKKISKVYVGVNGKAKQVYPSVNDWYTANGAIAKTNVLAAFNFKNASNDNEALTNIINSSTYKLTNTSCTRDSTGFLISINNGTAHYLDNASLRTAGIKSVVIKISSGSISSGVPLCGIGTVTGLSKQNDGPSIWLNLPFAQQSFAYKYTNKIGIAHGQGLSVSYNNGSTSGTRPKNYLKMGTEKYTNGVIGFSSTGYATGEALYHNGTAVTLSNVKNGNYEWTGFICSQVPRLIGGYAVMSDGSGWSALQGHHSFVGSFKVEYAAFYNITLTAAHHNTIASTLSSM